MNYTPYALIGQVPSIPDDWLSSDAAKDLSISKYYDVK